MALTSTSKVSDALAQYRTNLSWEGSPTKAAAALEAIRFLLTGRPGSASVDGSAINYDSLQQEKERLERYIDAVGTASNRSPFVRGRPKL